MLHQLKIEGLAIIENATIELGEQFNVLTGETGAGKSILIKALQFLMGGKTTSDVLRAGHTQALVSGLFLIDENHPIVFSLQNLGIPFEIENSSFNLIIRRQMNAQGKTLAWMNDVSVGVHALKEIGSLLVDVFSQHENQKLLDRSRHTDYLNSFLKEKNILLKCKKTYQEVASQVSLLIEDWRTYEEGQRNLDFLVFRLKELESFDPTEEDYAELELILSKAKGQLETKGYLRSALAILNPESQSGLSDQLKQLEKRVGKINLDLLKRLEPLRETLEDIHYELTRHYEDLDVSEETVESARERLFTYRDLIRKHQVSGVKELQEVRSSLAQKVQSMEHFVPEWLKKAEQVLDKIQSLDTLMDELSDARRETALEIEARIHSELSDLAMKGCEFSVRFEEIDVKSAFADLNWQDPRAEKVWNKIESLWAKLSTDGKERAHFFLKSNPGELFLPLEKIASGGEVSRIMLAIKKVLSSDADTCVMVFDEIDSGISGKVADLVGRKIKHLAERFQVICISHLPQVAVYANTHLFVSKKTHQKRTETHIRTLSKEESISEIARMLSGEEISSTSIENAKALITKALLKPTSLRA